MTVMISKLLIKKLTAAQRNAITGEAQVSPNTVRRWENGQPLRPVSLLRIEKAIDRLNSTRGKVR